MLKYAYDYVSVIARGGSCTDLLALKEGLWRLTLPSEFCPPHPPGVPGRLSEAGFFPHPALEGTGGEFGAGLRNPCSSSAPQMQKVGNHHRRGLQESSHNEV